MGCINSDSRVPCLGTWSQFISLLYSSLRKVEIWCKSLNFIVNERYWHLYLYEKYVIAWAQELV